MRLKIVDKRLIIRG